MNEIYKIEFDILEYINNEGRLLNGNCCSGYKSSGLCRGGNATCRPFWKICLTDHHQQNSLNKEIIIPTERQKDHTTEKPSFIKNVFNRFFSNSPNTKNKFHHSNNNYIENNQTKETHSTCSIAYWTTKTIDKNTIFPISLNSFVPGKLIHKFNKSHEDNGRKLLTLIEIWHEQNTDINDKLIYRYIETNNLTVGNEWQFINKTSSGLQFKYKFRVVPTELSDLSIINMQDTNNCPDGWKGESCREPICLEGCDQNHG